MTNENGNTQLARVAHRGALMPAQTLEVAKKRRDDLVAFVQSVMVKDVDYGIIPGSERPTLLKPGAERLLTFFGLDPHFVEVRVVEDFDGGLFFYRYKCELYRDGEHVGEGLGSCNSHEKKYRWRNAALICPECDGAFIRKAADNWDCKWYCHRKTGGCGARFGADDRIDSQKVGRVQNPDLADTVNTIDKIAQKRALIAAVLITVNASEFFTQDLDDLGPQGDDGRPRKPEGDAQGEPGDADPVDQRPADERPAGKGSTAKRQTQGERASAMLAQKAAEKTAQAPAPVDPPKPAGDPVMGGRDYSRNSVFIADVKREAAARLNFTIEQALALVGSTAKKHGKNSLSECDNDWRNSFMASLEGGLLDNLKVEPETTTEPASTEQGVAEQLAAVVSELRADEPKAAAEAGPAHVDVGTWDKFEALWNDAAIGQGWGPGDASAVLSKRLRRIDKHNRRDDTTTTWRLATLAAIRAGKIDKTTGGEVKPEPTAAADAQATASATTVTPQLVRVSRKKAAAK